MTTAYTETLEAQGQFSWFVDFQGTKNVDLVSLIPKKFANQQLLTSFLGQCGRMVGEWMSAVDNMGELIDPYAVGASNISYLADMIGLTLIQDSTTTIADERAMLVEAVNWYKLRGTYNGMLAISRMNNLDAYLYDLYCPPTEAGYNDFSQYRSPAGGWFCALTPGQNPPDIPVGWMKSPHFIYEINLNYVYNPGGDEHLWRDMQALRVTRLVESMRPVNTVPHQRLALRPECKMDGQERTIAGNIRCSTVGDWSTTRLYFDMLSAETVIDQTGNLVVDRFGNQVVANEALWSFDADPAQSFDWAGSGLLVTSWTLGIGNKGGHVGPTFQLQHPLGSPFTGTFDQIDVQPGYVDYVFSVPKAAVQAGISELALYLGTDIQLGATFPDIDKDDQYDLRITVRVYSA